MWGMKAGSVKTVKNLNPPAPLHLAGNYTKARSKVMSSSAHVPKSMQLVDALNPT